MFSSLANLPSPLFLEIRWNFAGAFIGCAAGVTPAPDSGTTDNRSLLFDYFLAAPPLDINNETTERKFSGNEDVGNNTDPLGCVIDAYVHHALIDSLGDMLFADVQGMYSLYTGRLHYSDIVAYGLIGVVLEDGSLCLFDPQAHTCVSLYNTSGV